MTIHVALWEPEIPPNTGNIARLCAATGAKLHIVGQPAFRLDDKQLKRAGLDYWEAVDWQMHASFSDLEALISPEKIILIETTEKPFYTQAPFVDGCCLVFGNESRGLPQTIRDRYADRLFGVPMPTGKVRSLNLATCAGIVLYEALRQLNNW